VRDFFDVDVAADTLSYKELTKCNRPGIALKHVSGTLARVY
jgi:hypothetical protein